MQELTDRDELHRLADTLEGPAADALLAYARWLVVRHGETLTETEPGSQRAAVRGQGDGLKELLDELLGDA